MSANYQHICPEEVREHPHLRRLLTEYEDLEHRLRKIRSGSAVHVDAERTLKKRRLQIRDRIARFAREEFLYSA